MSKSQAEAIIKQVLQQGRTSLSEHEAKGVLEAYGIPVTKELVVKTTDELAEALKSFALPVVLKVDSPDILHKTEAGLVKLNLRTMDEATAAFADIMERARQYNPRARINGVLLQEMVTDCTECIVGVKRDQQFGPAIAFGLGGIFVEVFEDVALRVAPLTERDASEMIRETKGYKILAGARGRPKADIAAVEDVLLKVSQLSLDLEACVSEIDINPLMVCAEGRGAKAVDALIVLSPAE